MQVLSVFQKNQIMAQVTKILAEVSAGVVSSEKGRMELLTQRRSLVERNSKTFGSLTRHFNKTIASQAVALLLITLPLAQELSLFEKN
jgi:hypothetical protein